MKPQLRFKEFTDDWEEKKLGEIIIFLNGRAYKQSELLDNGKYIVLRVGNLFSNPEIYYSNMELDEDKYISNGDLIYAWSATFGPRIWKGPKVIYHYHIWKLILKNFDNKYFINYLLEFDVHRVNTKRTGGTLTHITKKVMEDRNVLLPSLSEQEKIGKFFSLLDQRIEKQERKVALLEEEKKGYMQKLFKQGLRFKDEQGNDYPDWEEKKLGEITKIKTGNADLQDKDKNGKYPFFVRSIQVERINTYDYDGEAILIPGDGKIGDVYHYINGKFNYHQRVYKISDFSVNVMGKYIYYYMIFYFKKEAMKNSVKATVDSLRLPTIQNFKIQFPVLAEQEKIANFLSLLDQRIEKEQEKLKLMREEKKGLMQRMFV